MKIFKYLFVIVLISSFMSCSEDDLLTEQELIGTWLLKEANLEGNATFTQGTDVTTADFTGEGYDLDLKITINENPKDYIVEGDINVLVTYDFDGQTIELPIEEADFIDNGTWDITDDVLTVSNSTQVETANLGQLTETSMSLEWTYIESVTTTTGSIIVHEVTGTYEFEKQ